MNYLDIITTVLGLIYIWLEYRASIMLWLVGIVMPALDIILYWTHGLYGDAAMAVYYTVAAIYGWIVWKFGKKHNQAESAVSAGFGVLCCGLGSDLVCPVALYQLKHPHSRCLHQRPQFCWIVDIGP